jgi:hypothetical protein
MSLHTDGLDPSPLEALPGHGFLGLLAVDLREALRVDRVTVVVADPAACGGGIVAACLGAPGMLGRHVPLLEEPATGYKSPAEAAALGLAGEGERELPWSFAYVPIAPAGQPIGAVTLVSRRARIFTDRDLSFVQRLASRRAAQFEPVPLPRPGSSRFARRDSEVAA